MSATVKLTCFACGEVDVAPDLTVLDITRPALPRLHYRCPSCGFHRIRKVAAGSPELAKLGQAGARKYSGRPPTLDDLPVTDHRAPLGAVEVDATVAAIQSASPLEWRRLLSTPHPPCVRCPPRSR